jgi:hypothetical protein
MFNGAGDDPDPHCRQHLDVGKRIDLDDRAVREHQLGASFSGSQAIAFDEGHVCDCGLQVTIVFDGRRALDKREVRRRQLRLLPCLHGGWVTRREWAEKDEADTEAQDE